MKDVKMLTVCLIAVLGCLAGVAASASATALQWGFCKLGNHGPYSADCTSSTESGFEEALLQSGETLLLLARGVGAQKLEAITPEFSISCSTLQGHGWLLGGAPGLGQGVIIYSGCSLPGKPKCDVSTGGGALGAITTNQLEAELVYLSKAAAEGSNPEESGALFRPVGSTTFVTIELHPLETGGCPINGNAAVKGQVLTKNDQAAAKVLLHTLLALEPAIEKYFEASGSEKKVKQLQIAGINATYVGVQSLDVTELNGPAVAWWVCP
jgi:hypothetical protein